jgi:hypothetical protein
MGDILARTDHAWSPCGMNDQVEGHHAYFKYDARDRFCQAY